MNLLEKNKIAVVTFGDYDEPVYFKDSNKASQYCLYGKGYDKIFTDFKNSEEPTEEEIESFRANKTISGVKYYYTDRSGKVICYEEASIKFRKFED